ncbi:MAG: hypothetical protein NC182_04380 [Prevotella sp.]|nr:hypothetical protein [Staphylococcus sp.]MCM1350419.1 hypothetical protein [Prevotella sp.]
MKRIFFCLVLCLCCMASIGCKKQSKAQYVGVYIEVVETNEKSLTDENIKLYIDVTKNNQFEEVNHLTEYQNVCNSKTYNLYQEDGVEVYDFSAVYTITFPTRLDKKKIDVYPIVYQNQEFIIVTQMKKTISLETNQSKGVLLSESYRLKKQDYHLKASIKIIKKEV